MFSSFFPFPRLFFPSVIIWTLVCIGCWYGFAADLGVLLGSDGENPTGEVVIGVQHFFTPEYIWFDIYYAAATALFAFAWHRLQPHAWAVWSIIGSSFLIFLAYTSVQVSVVINAWYGPFYNDIQKALTGDQGVTSGDIYGHLLIFCSIAFPYIGLIIFRNFFTSHFIFRWRTAMNDYFTAQWERVRHIEGASQRVQEDTMRFASIMETLGIAFVDSIMTLIAFIPVLAALSVHVESIPVLGSVPYALVFLALAWSAFGTALLILAGVNLPGLEFKNQRVEAAYRKELVFGEDNAERAAPPTLRELFQNVRRNYFRIYIHYTYFNLFRYMYLQADNVIAYVFLVPTIVSGQITLGIMNQIIRAFGQVASSFQFLVFSWTTIIELISIYKRLQGFENAIDGLPLPRIDEEFIKAGEKEI